jgi:hypothetical protein
MSLFDYLSLAWMVFATAWLALFLWLFSQRDIVKAKLLQWMSSSSKPVFKEGRLPQWVSECAEVIVEGHAIDCGFFYMGHLDAHCSEQHKIGVIDPRLPIRVSPVSYTDASLKMAQNYVELSPECRGAFLGWLADFEQTPAKEYALLYISGLERYVLESIAKQPIDSAVFCALFAKLQKIQHKYPTGHAVLQATSQVMALILCYCPDAEAFSDNPELWQHSELWRHYSLSALVSNHQPLPAELVFSWLTHHHRMTTAESPSLFSKLRMDLFVTRFQAQWPTGFIIKPNKRVLNAEYVSMAGHRTALKFPYLTEASCDPTQLTAPLKAAQSLLQNCMAEMKAWEQHSGNSTNLAAKLALPLDHPMLKQDPEVQELKHALLECLAADQGLLDLPRLWAQWPLNTPASTAVERMPILTQLAALIDAEIIPNAEVYGIEPDASGQILMHLTASSLQASPPVAETCLLIQTLSVLQRSNRLSAGLEQDQRWNDCEKKSLQAFISWCDRQSFKLETIKQPLSELAPHQKRLFAETIRDVVCSEQTMPAKDKQVYQELLALLALKNDRVDVPATETMPA